MSRVFTYLGRFAVIIAGFAFAALSASAFLSILSLGTLDWGLDEAPMAATEALGVSIPVAALFIAYFAFVPAVPAILIGEVLGRRDWLFYAAAGAIIALIVIALLGGPFDTGGMDEGDGPADPRFSLAVIAGGMVGGIAYWLLAGRTAGIWRDRIAAGFEKDDRNR